MRHYEGWPPLSRDNGRPNQRLHADALPRDGEPPETKQTLDRLVAEGHSQSEARRLIAAVVASEIFEVLKRKRPYDRAGYVAALQRLPKMPWDR